MTPAEALRSSTLAALVSMTEPPMMADRYRSVGSILAALGPDEGITRAALIATLADMVAIGVCCERRGTHTPEVGYRWHGGFFQTMRHEAAGIAQSHALAAMSQGDLPASIEHGRRAQLLLAQVTYEGGMVATPDAGRVHPASRQDPDSLGHGERGPGASSDELELRRMARVLDELADEAARRG